MLLAAGSVVGAVGLASACLIGYHVWDKAQFTTCFDDRDGTEICINEGQFKDDIRLFNYNTLQGGTVQVRCTEDGWYKWDRTHVDKEDWVATDDEMDKIADRHCSYHFSEGRYHF